MGENQPGTRNYYSQEHILSEEKRNIREQPEHNMLTIRNIKIMIEYKEIHSTWQQSRGEAAEKWFNRTLNLHD